LDFAGFNFTISGGNTQSIAGFTTTTGTFTNSKSGGTATLTGAINVANLSQSGGTLNLGTSLVHTVSGNVTISSGTLNGGSSTLKVGGNFGTSNTFTAGTSTIELNGIGAQQAGGAYTFYNLIINKSSGTATFGGNPIVTNQLTVLSGTLDGTTRTIILRPGSSNTPFDVQSPGVFTPSTSTVQYEGKSGITTSIGGLTFNNLTLDRDSGTPTYTLNGSIEVSNTLNILQGTLVGNANTITLSGSGTVFKGGDKFNAGTSTVRYTGTGATLLDKATTFYTLEAAGSGTLSQDNQDIVILNVFTLTSGTYDGNGKKITLNASGTPLVVQSGAVFSTANNNTQVIYKGSTTTNVAAITYSKLQFDNVTGVFNATGTTNATTEVDVKNGTFNLSNYDMTVTTGTLKVTGTITQTGGTVTLDGSGKISGGGSITLYNLTYTGGTVKSQTVAPVAVTVTNLLTLGANTTLQAGDDIYDLKGSGTPFVMGAGAVLTAQNSTMKFTNATGATIAAAKASNGGGYANLVIGGGASGSFNGDGDSIIVKKVLTISSNATFNGQNQVITLSGTGTPYVNNGTFTAGTSTVQYTGNNSTNVTGGMNYYNLEVTTSDASIARTFTLTMGGIAVNGNLTIGNVRSVLADGGFTITVRGNISNAGSHTGAGKILVQSVAPGPKVVGESSASNTVTLQTLSGTGSYTNLEIDNADGAQMLNSFTINGTLTLTNGQLDLNGNTLTMAINTTIVRSGGSLSGAPTAAGVYNVTYTGSSNVTTGAEIPSSPTALQHLTMTMGGNSNTVTLNSNPVYVNGNLTLNAGTFADNGNTVGLVGNATNNAIHSSTGTGGIAFIKPGGPQTISGSGVYGNVAVSSTSTTSLGSDVTILGGLGLDNGTLSVGSWTLTLGNIIVVQNGGVLSTTASSKITTTGSAGPIVLPSSVAMLDVLTAGTSNTTALSGALNVNTVLINAGVFNPGANSITVNTSANVNTTGTVTLNGTTITGAGSLTNNGTINVANTNTVSLSAFTNGSTGTIAGTGTLDVSGTTGGLSNEGNLSPGASPGVLTIQGDLVLNSSSNLVIEIGGTTAGTDFDQIIVTGAVTLGGTITTSLINTYAPAPASTYAIMTFASQTGSAPTVSDTEFAVNVSTTNLVLTRQYPVPTVVSASPNSAVQGQTLDVTITGTNFVNNASTVSLGVGITVDSTTVISSTSLLVKITVAGNAVVGTRDISVTNPAPGGGTGTAAAGFTVQPGVPTVSNITPASSIRGQTLDVTLTGTNFITGATTSFGAGITVNSTSVNSSTTILANITIAGTAALGSRDVTVTNPSTLSTTVSNGFSVTSAAAATISTVSGTPQSGTVGAQLANDFIVLVVDAFNNPVQGVNVVLAIQTTPAGATGQSLTSTNVTTGSNGQASTRLTLGNRPGTYTVTATSGTLSGSPQTFTATATVGAAASMVLSSGNNQTGPINTHLINPFVVTVRDGLGNPVPGVAVQFAPTVVPANQVGAGMTAMSVTTNVNGQASSTLYLGSKVGTYVVAATSAGLAGSPVSFTATATAGSPTAMSMVSGNGQATVTGNTLSFPFVVQVTDIGGNPVSGASVLFAITSTPIGAVGQSLTVSSTTTNQQGQASTTLRVGNLPGLYVVTATSFGAGSATFTATATSLTSVEKVDAAVPSDFSLSQNYPNPFNPSTRIRFGLPEESAVHIQLYNVLGNLVAELVNERLGAGVHEVVWKADDAPSGVYILRIRSEGTSRVFTSSKRMTLLK